ncbi:hypothetical protein BDP27DRAFT_1403484 [Rhodocollybia butyracea]|uniref:Uncharacterized protein n=1 Tax=Rhodocollybia butyracea TaxID=206335 RepID=A0A9P5PT59_9AGAR|nr:hypothetical protein BDP27DRAFT_1403484 [Rhodocollybia butyracea]
MTCLFRPLAQTRLRLQRPISSFLVHEPPSSASRIVPTPLVFVSASKWDHSSTREGFSVLAKMYSEKGYICLDTDIAVSANTNPANVMQHLESELKSVVRSSFNPFPPVFFARGAACLITQTYISSNPASGLILMSPPVSNSSISQSILSHALPEFNFEPAFPIAIVDTPQGMAKLQTANNRLANDDRVDKIIVDDLEGQDAFVKMEQWMDDIGI